MIITTIAAVKRQALKFGGGSYDLIKLRKKPITEFTTNNTRRL